MLVLPAHATVYGFGGFSCSLAAGRYLVSCADAADDIVAEFPPDEQVRARLANYSLVALLDLEVGDLPGSLSPITLDFNEDDGEGESLGGGDQLRVVQHDPSTADRELQRVDGRLHSMTEGILAFVPDPTQDRRLRGGSPVFWRRALGSDLVLVGLHAGHRADKHLSDAMPANEEEKRGIEYLSHGQVRLTYGPMPQMVP